MNDTMPALAEPLTRDGEAFADWRTPESLGDLIPPGSTMIQTQGREITAKKVAVPRDMRRIMAELKVMCAEFGDGYVYSWEANDRQNNRKVLIEGPTIKLANDLVQLYGNCATDCDVIETKTHWIFKAFFIDYEKGTATPRLFQQRKRQNTGMKDADRQADIVFQIGQSKAIRNAVTNALSSLSGRAVELAKTSLIERFRDEGNAQKARAFIERVMGEHGVTFHQVEAVVGRVRTEWTVRDLARVYMEMRGIHEGLTVASEVYPSDDDAGKVMAEKRAKDAAGRRGDKDEEGDGGDDDPAPSKGNNGGGGARPAGVDPGPQPGQPAAEGQERNSSVSPEKGDASTKPKPEGASVEPARFAADEAGNVVDGETGEIVPEQFVKWLPGNKFSVLKGYHQQQRKDAETASEPARETSANKPVDPEWDTGKDGLDIPPAARRTASEGGEKPSTARPSRDGGGSAGAELFGDD